MLDICAGRFHKLAQERKWGIWMPNGNYLALVLYADNWWLYATSPLELQAMTRAWLQLLRGSGWDTPGETITWYTTASDEVIVEIRADNIILNRVPRKTGFKVLGAIITFDNRFDAELKARTANAWEAFYRVQAILRNSQASLRKRLSLLKTFVYPSLFWAAGSWNLDQQQLATLRDVHQKDAWEDAESTH